MSHPKHSRGATLLTHRVVDENPQRYGSLGNELAGDAIGWDDAGNLAKKSTESALKSTENYSLFILAMYWSDWCWGSEGKAVEFLGGTGKAGTC